MTAALRVFVALPVPKDIAARVDGALDGLRERHADLRWSRPDGWHVTLAFLGSVEESSVGNATDAVRAAVRALDVGPIHLSLGAAGHFKRRVLWLGLDDAPTGAVAETGRAIQRRVVEAGLPCDEKAVHPHLTLARTRGRSRLPHALTDRVPEVDGSWTAGTVEVLRSRLGRGGSRYETLAAVPLG